MCFIIEEKFENWRFVYNIDEDEMYFLKSLQFLVNFMRRKRAKLK